MLGSDVVAVFAYHHCLPHSLTSCQQLEGTAMGSFRDKNFIHSAIDPVKLLTRYCKPRSSYITQQYVPFLTHPCDVWHPCMCLAVLILHCVVGWCRFQVAGMKP